MKRKTNIKSKKGKGLIKSIYNYATNKRLPGETQIPQLTFDWSGVSIKPATYAGPHTKTLTHIKQHDKPINTIDAISIKHDLVYSKARNSEDIKNADWDYVKSAFSGKNLLKGGINNIISGIGILGKIGIDKIRGKPKGGETGDYYNLSKEDQELTDKTIKEMNDQGYGNKKKKPRKKPTKKKAQKNKKK